MTVNNIEINKVNTYTRYDHPKRPLAFLKGTKKMVARTYYPFTLFYGNFNCNWRRKRGSSVYLYHLLKLITLIRMRYEFV
ncbi:hypothetical protein, partial [Xanthovirga aplysinae]|uniref:hypothetical protein n=1 Tax=Xanthovirga aplysinae TaxID=2529853 RepID=UPI003CCD26F4